jgi:eukaryotic-like serine/threonine-protein kinase
MKKGRTRHRSDTAESDLVRSCDTAQASTRTQELRIRSWGHLELKEKLGQGGFGSVYCAWDPSLRRDVALKLLESPERQSITQKETILREGRYLARIRHENVATVYGVGEHDGVVGLWMELIRGKSLEELLRQNGPFGARESAGIGIELCSALSAVHRVGLVHGDISAKNVIRENGGRLVLVDLGLGERQHLASTERQWKVAGTPAYMAPEMLRGHGPSVRTDVYALGVLIFHLVTGEYPVEGTDVGRLENQDRSHESRLVRDRRPDVPESFCAVVERALAPDPAQRFHSAGEFQLALEGAWKSGGIEENQPASRKNWPMLPGAAVGFMVLLLVVYYFAWARLPRIPEGSEIVLADIENKTTDPQLDGATSLLRSQLSQLPYFDLMEESVIRDALQRMALRPGIPLARELAREVAWREGADLVVAGQLSSLGGSYLLNLQVEKAGDDPGAPETTWTKTFQAKDKNDLFEVIDQSGAWIRSVVGQATAGGSKTLPSREATTASWEALDSFSRAEDLQERGRSNDAVLLLQEAVRIDPDFALAHMRMGDILISLGRHREGYQAWQHALRTVGSVRLTRREELRIEGLYAYDTNDFNQAEKTFRTFSLQYPNDYYPSFHHAFALRAQGRYEEALQQLERAAARRPSLFHIPAQLARTWMLMGRLDLAAGQADRLREMGQAEWALVMEGACRFLETKFDEAEARFRQLIDSRDPEWQSGGYELLAYMLGELGRFEESLQLLEQGIRHDSQHEMSSRKADKLIAKAYLSYRRGDAAECRRACLEALEFEAGPLRLARAGSLLARSGANKEAERLLDQFNEEPESPVFRLAENRIRGELLLKKRRYSEALSFLQEAAELEPFYATKEYLARALAESGRNAEALEEYVAIKDSPARFWQMPEGEYPGLYADSLLRCAQIAEAVNRTEVAEEARGLYRELRPSGRATEGKAVDEQRRRPEQAEWLQDKKGVSYDYRQLDKSGAAMRLGVVRDQFRRGLRGVDVE